MNVDAAPRAHGQSQGTNWRWECVAKSGGEMIIAAVNRDKHMPYIVWWQQFSKQVHKNCDASTQMANWYNYSVLRNQDLQHQALSQMTKKADNCETGEQMQPTEKGVADVGPGMKETVLGVNQW